MYCGWYCSFVLLRIQPFYSFQIVVLVEGEIEGRVSIASTASEYPHAIFRIFRSLARKWKILVGIIPNPYVKWNDICYAQLNPRCFTARQKIASWKCGKLPLVPMENLFTVYGKGQALSHKPANRFPTAPPGLAVYTHSHNACCCEYLSFPIHPGDRDRVQSMPWYKRKKNRSAAHGSFTEKLYSCFALWYVLKN